MTKCLGLYIPRAFDLGAYRPMRSIRFRATSNPTSPWEDNILRIIIRNIEIIPLLPK